MHELSETWSDEDRRDGALERLLITVESHSVELDPSQLLALRTVSHGLTEAEAADLLGWSHDSVKDRLKAARRLLAAKSTLHAVAIALRLGLIT